MARSNCTGIQLVESNVTVTEGSIRQIVMQRQQNLNSSLNLTVFVTTTKGYRQQQQTQCNITLSKILGCNESDIDPAEGIYCEC